MTTELRIFAPSPRACEACGADCLEEFIVPGRATLWHCPQCNLYQNGEGASGEDYGCSYHEQIYAARRGHKLWTAAVRLNRIASLLDMPVPKLLDVGCSLGSTVEAASRRGWDAHGVDVSEYAVRFCRDRKLNCRVTRSLELPYNDGSFDVLTAWHVIEHVADVRQTLVEWHRVLKPDGLLVLETPDGACLKVRMRGVRYRRFWTPEHVYTFDRKNLVRLAEAAGFEIVSPPLLGQLTRLPPRMAIYAVGYQLNKGLQFLLRMNKAFDMFCRRRSAVTVAFPLRHAQAPPLRPLRRAA